MSRLLLPLAALKCNHHTVAGTKAAWASLDEVGRSREDCTLLVQDSFSPSLARSPTWTRTTSASRWCLSAPPSSGAPSPCSLLKRKSVICLVCAACFPPLFAYLLW